ncbi:MAG: efflux RND transporter periplasmic adaptor subunit [Pseudomonadota bacterium]
MSGELPTTSNQNKSNRLRRLIRRTAAVLVTGVVVAAAGGIIWQSTGLIAERAAAVEKPLATQPVLVETSPISMVDRFEVSRSFSGQIEAPQLADLSFEQGGTIKLIDADEGQTVSEGQIVARLDDRILKAELQRIKASRAAVEAQRELLTLNNERAVELNRKGFAANQALDQTRLGLVELDARVAEMDATLTSIEIQLEKLTITAPFNGTISKRQVDPGTTIGGGQPVVSIVENADPVFRVGIDPQLSQNLSTGDVVRVTFGDIHLDAQIIGFLPQLDPTTRTQTVRAQLPQTSDVTIGQTGEVALIESVKTRGAWVPLSAIEDGVRGLWTIKTVRPGVKKTVGIEAVELLHVDEKNAFVRGTFGPESELILSGLHRIVTGQTIRTENQ